MTDKIGKNYVVLNEDLCHPLALELFYEFVIQIIIIRAITHKVLVYHLRWLCQRCLALILHICMQAKEFVIMMSKLGVQQSTLCYNLNHYRNKQIYNKET